MVYSMNCDAVNDYFTILYQFLGLIYVGQDDKTGVQVGRTFPISATAQHSIREIVLTGQSVECGGHDFSSENLTPSATIQMNLTNTLV